MRHPRSWPRSHCGALSGIRQSPGTVETASSGLYGIRGVDGALPDADGMSADELASLMNDLLRRFNTTKRQLPGARSSARSGSFAAQLAVTGCGGGASLWREPFQRRRPGRGSPWFATLQGVAVDLLPIECWRARTSPC